MGKTVATMRRHSSRVREKGNAGRRSTTPGKGKGYRTVTHDGFEILVGKGEAENDHLTFALGEPRDFWLHVAGPAGSHVVVRNRGALEEPPRPVIERAAELAAFYSKARAGRGKVEVHVCRVADVSKPRGFPPGQVLLRRWRVVRVYPRGIEGS
jgi:predicted ribosome quality control (RQC) complex YloA/Tae2 family protein